MLVAEPEYLAQHLVRHCDRRLVVLVVDQVNDVRVGDENLEILQPLAGAIAAAVVDDEYLQRPGVLRSSGCKGSLGQLNLVVAEHEYGEARCHSVHPQTVQYPPGWPTSTW